MSACQNFTTLSIALSREQCQESALSIHAVTQLLLGIAENWGGTTNLLKITGGMGAAQNLGQKLTANPTRLLAGGRPFRTSPVRLYAAKCHSSRSFLISIPNSFLFTKPGFWAAIRPSRSIRKVTGRAWMCTPKRPKRGQLPITTG